MPRRSLRIRSRKESEDEVEKIDSQPEKKNDVSSYVKSSTSLLLDQSPTTTSDEVENECFSDADSDDLESFADTFADTVLNRLCIQNNKKSTMISHKQESTSKPSSTIDVGDLNLDGYISVDTPSVGNRKILDLYTGTGKDDPVMKYSVITPDFETKHEVPKELGKRALKKQRRAERNATSGKKWFNMKAPELTEEVKRDMKILQMRSVLDPKRFYKKNDRKTIPKYFQIGKVMDNAADFYSSRVPMKQRKATLADELLADANFKRYQKRKFNEIQAKRRAMGGFRKFQTRRKGKRKAA